MKQQSFILIIILVMILSCQKDTEILTEATQTGKGTFACMYDGKVWNADPEVAYAEYDHKDGPRITIIAYHSDFTMYLLLYNATKPGVYVMSPRKAGIWAWVNADTSYNDISGSIELTTFDTINKVISGRFNADMALSPPFPSLQGGTNPKSTYKDTFTIRSGRFDLPLKIYP